MALIPVSLQQACDAASESFSGEVIQQPCDSGAMWLELWQHGHKMDELYLDQDMLEVFINLEAYYRQQGIDNSAVYAFQKLSDAGC
ncbi:hypothetical protein B9H00_00385 [Kushneria marisflavi]|uniref:Uncharacterized protein n=2 Tax=Kushneria marisflavi TaxID=157779 RepID=A0A240UJM9_9GAMM|nr:hypothetical protein B9H00_00385 [Kushneria marisflavi]